MIGEQPHIEMHFWQFTRNIHICVIPGKLMEQHFNASFDSNPGDKILFIAEIQCSQDLRVLHILVKFQEVWLDCWLLCCNKISHFQVQCRSLYKIFIHFCRHPTTTLTNFYWRKNHIFIYFYLSSSVLCSGWI